MIGFSICTLSASFHSAPLPRGEARLLPLLHKEGQHQQERDTCGEEDVGIGDKGGGAVVVNDHLGIFQHLLANGGAHHAGIST